MDTQSFSGWLKQKLSDSSLTPSELAQRARLSKPLVYFYISGKRLPTPDSANKLARALGVAPEIVAQYARKGLGCPPKRQGQGETK